jgi:hypothetical protein
MPRERREIMLRDLLQKPPVEVPKEPYGEPLLMRHGTLRNVTETKYGEKHGDKNTPDRV